MFYLVSQKYNYEVQNSDLKISEILISSKICLLISINVSLQENIIHDHLSSEVRLYVNSYLAISNIFFVI